MSKEPRASARGIMAGKDKMDSRLRGNDNDKKGLR